MQRLVVREEGSGLSGEVTQTGFVLAMPHMDEDLDAIMRAARPLVSGKKSARVK